MPYVQRDQSGKIVGVYQQPQPGYATEEVAEDAPELLERAAAHQAMLQEQAAKTRLREIDLASVRALREYVAAKADAPQILKDREAEAVAERTKLK